MNIKQIPYEHQGEVLKLNFEVCYCKLIIKYSRSHLIGPELKLYHLTNDINNRWDITIIL